MTAPLHEYGLMIDRRNNYGTDYIEVHVVRREPGRDMPLGCSSDGESFYGEGTPKHLMGLRLDGLGIYGFVSDYEGQGFIGSEVTYQNVHTMDEAKLRGMVKTIKRINDRVNKDFAREPGDKFMALAAALKLTFAVHRIGPRRSNPDWRWMTITEGRNYYRSEIEAVVTEKTKQKTGVA